MTHALCIIKGNYIQCYSKVNKSCHCEDVARQNLKEWFGKYSTIDKTSSDYEKAMKYIENERNYITAEENKSEYIKQLLEAEAYGVEPKGDEIIEHLASIWRLPFSK